MTALVAQTRRRYRPLSWRDRALSSSIARADRNQTEADDQKALTVERRRIAAMVASNGLRMAAYAGLTEDKNWLFGNEELRAAVAEYAARNYAQADLGACDPLAIDPGAVSEAGDEILGTIAYPCVAEVVLDAVRRYGDAGPSGVSASAAPPPGLPTVDDVHRRTAELLWGASDDCPLNTIADIRRQLIDEFGMQLFLDAKESLQ